MGTSGCAEKAGSQWGRDLKQRRRRESQEREKPGESSGKAPPTAMPDVDWEGKRRSGRLEGALCEPDGGEGIVDQGRGVK